MGAFTHFSGTEIGGCYSSAQSDQYVQKLSHLEGSHAGFCPFLSIIRRVQDPEPGRVPANHAQARPMGGTVLMLAGAGNPASALDLLESLITPHTEGS